MTKKTESATEIACDIIVNSIGRLLEDERLTLPDRMIIMQSVLAQIIFQQTDPNDLEEVLEMHITQLEDFVEELEKNSVSAH